MLTESEARDLLAKAANTVEVAPGQRIEKASRSIWPMLAAAAAVVAIVGTTAAVVDRTSDHTGPPTVGPTTATASPKPVLAADQIPSVFAYDADSATRLLQSSGLKVTTKPDYVCRTTGRATKTDPAVGTRFQPADAVTLFVTQIPPNARCVEPADEVAAWRFLDFANGRGPAPAFADEVNVYVDGVAQTLTGAEAADPDSWGGHSALEALAADSREVVRRGASYATPHLSVDGSIDPGQAVSHFCGQLPPGTLSRPAVWLGVWFPRDGINICPFKVGIFETDGRIDVIAFRTVPPVEAEVSDPDGIGAPFVEFARGEIDSPPVAREVDLYVGNEFVKTISREDAADPSAWKVCPAAGGYAARTCPFSALQPIRESAPVAFTATAPQHPCVHLDRSLPGSLSNHRFVTVEDAGFTDCTGYYGIQLFLNDTDEVVAANVVWAEP